MARIYQSSVFRKVCEQCGKQYIPTPCSRNRFCSRQCFRQNGRENSRPMALRLWKHVDITEPQLCWEWRGGLNEDGYGTFHGSTYHGEPRSIGAHRAAWLVTMGSIPDGLWVLHRCDNPACVNPAHLYLGTHADNINDMKRRGRVKTIRGSAHANAKLREADVKTIRQAWARGEPVARFARQLGVSPCLVHRVARGEAWKHVT